MLKALTNELLKFLLQPFELFPSCCSALPAARATSPWQSTQNRGRVPTQALELTGLHSLSCQRRWVEYKVEGGHVDTHSVLLTWFMVNKLLWERSNMFSCCSDLLREHVKTLRMNPEAITLLCLLPSSLLR